jgi:hypothetical protein
LDAGRSSALADQIYETVADGYSLYHVLSNILDGSGRLWLDVLKLNQEPLTIQNAVLLYLVIVAVGGYFFMHPARALTRLDLYRRSHPPSVIRIDCLMQEMRNWCGQNLPDLLPLMAPSRVRQLMNAVAEATQGLSGAQVHGVQAAFFLTDEGREYSKALADGVNAYKRSL